jgi:ATP-binding cassette subfamily B protein
MASNQRTNFPQRRGPMGGGPGMNFGEKPKDFKKALKKIIKYLKPYYTSLIVAILFAIIGTTFSIIGPKLLGNITNEVQYAIDENRGIDFTEIASIAYMLIGIYLFSYLFSNIQVFIFNRITQNLSKKLRTEIVEKINKLPLSYFNKRSYGDVLSRVTNDVDTIAQTMNQSLSFFITAVTSIIGITVMMFSISWQLTLIVLIFTPVSIILISFIMKFSQKHFRKHQSSLGLVNGHIEEIYTGHSIIKTFNAHEKTKKEFTYICVK